MRKWRGLDLSKGVATTANAHVFPTSPYAGRSTDEKRVPWHTDTIASNGVYPKNALIMWCASEYGGG
jgi:hypothetical protein